MSQGQARFTRRYSDQQKQALLKAVCTEGMTIPAAVEKAAAGELGVPAFRPNRQYAYEIIKAEREGYEAANPDAMRTSIDLAINRLAAKALRLARDLEKKQDPNPDEIKRTVQALKAAQHALAKPTAHKPATQEPNEPNQPQRATLDDLLKLANGGTRAGSVVRSPTSSAAS